MKRLRRWLPIAWRSIGSQIRGLRWRVVGVAAIGLLLATSPLRALDRACAQRLRAWLGAGEVGVVAVTLEPDLAPHAMSLVKLALAAGARSVSGPNPPSEKDESAPEGWVHTIDGRLLLNGQAPASLFANRVVVVDTMERAYQRAETSDPLAGKVQAPLPVLVSALLLAFFLASCRRPGKMAWVLWVLTGFAGAVAATQQVLLPLGELGLVPPVILLCTALDHALALRCALASIEAPLLRVTSTFYGLVEPGARAHANLFSSPQVGRARRLVDIVLAFDRDMGWLPSALAQARVGILLASTQGDTRWKNPRFDELCTRRDRPMISDLHRVLALLAERGETPASLLERLFAEMTPLSRALPKLGLAITLTPLSRRQGPRASALVVEVHPLDVAARHDTSAPGGHAAGAEA